MAGFRIDRPRVQEELALLRQLGRVRRLASLKKSFEQRAMPGEREPLHEFQDNENSPAQGRGAAFIPAK
jgi:hypothetical protein